MLFELFDKIKAIPNAKVRNLVIDKTMDRMIPFNRGLGFHIESLTHDKSIVSSPNRKRRMNHVKGAHACALALIGEYTAGILITQNYNPADFRIIIGELKIKYHKQGRGELRAESLAPENWPTEENGESWILMSTQIMNSHNELVAVCETNWQVKRWTHVRSKK